MTVGKYFFKIAIDQHLLFQIILVDNVLFYMMGKESHIVKRPRDEMSEGVVSWVICDWSELPGLLLRSCTF
jgi:hypothetical protein